MGKFRTLALSATLVVSTALGAVAQEVVKVAEPNWASGSHQSRH